MKLYLLPGGTLLFALVAWGPTLAQQPTPAAPTQPAAAATPPINPNAVAATVNGVPIPERAVQRGLRRLPPDQRDEARSEFIEYLVENIVIDQYLIHYKVEVPKEEIETRLNQFREDIKKQGGVYEKVLENLLLTEDELRAEITADLRWDRYANTQCNDKALQELFQKNPEMFDGTVVRARHILLTPPAGDAQAVQQAQTQLLQFKQQVEQEAAKGVAKLPPDADSRTREQTHSRLLEETFSAIAREKSACPTRMHGGDLGWFPRARSMVEPVAKAAFALKPSQMSDVVGTKFGYHLLLVIDRRPGTETKFEEVKEEVKEVHCAQLRDIFVTHLRPKANVVVHTAPK